MSKSNQFCYKQSKNSSKVTLLKAGMTDFTYHKHSHEEYSFGLTLEGQQNFFSHTAFHKSPPGGVMIFNPDQIHDGHAGNHQTLEYVMLYVHPDELAPHFKSLGVKNTDQMRPDSCLYRDKMMAQQILSLSQCVSSGSNNAIEFDALLHQLAYSVLRLSGGNIQSTDTLHRQDTLIQRSIDFIKHNTTENISVEQISDAANMSKFHFIRAFKKQIGITPHQYVINSRLKQVKNALQKGGSISQVSAEYNFADASHLNRRFKSVFGMTPKHYQQQILAS